MKPMISICLLSTLLFAAEQYYERGKLRSLIPESPVPREKEQTSSEKQLPRQSSDIRWYRNESGMRVGIDRKILVQWKNPENAAAVLNEFKLEEGEALTKTVWLIYVPDSADIFELSQKLYKHNSTILAHPNMIRERRMR